MHVHLLIPSLFWPDPTLPEIYQGLSLPALQNLIAKSTRTVEPALDADAWLCRAFGLAQQGQNDLPIAAITLQAETAESTRRSGFSPTSLTVGLKPNLLRADPVSIRIERDQMLLADSRAFSLTQAEADALAQTINQHFSTPPFAKGGQGGDGASLDFGLSTFPPFAKGGQGGFEVLPLHPTRWYLRLPERPALQTHTLAQAAGRNIRALLPRGDDSQKWHGLFNEIQMLLFDHPVNLAREARGAPLINSVWFWGGGVLPTDMRPPAGHVWSNDFLVQALMHAAGSEADPLPADASVYPVAVAGDHLLVLDALDGWATYGDAYHWREALLQFEKNWFAPLLAALKQGQGGLKKITITALGDNGVENFAVTRSDLWKFWKTGKYP